MTLSLHFRTPILRASFAILLLSSAAVRADDIDQLPVTATFVISGGFWEGDGGEIESAPDVAGSGTATPVPTQPVAPQAGAKTEPQRGYYKLVAIRQPDRTAKIYLQQIQSAESGPKVLESVELEEFSAIKAYVTDIRPEDSTGVSRQPGLFATVYLKTDPQQMEPEGWTVLIDEFGDIRVERETN
ncbi:hypothetical protein G6N76_12040 [Rhizobium daejeonense]|uniref:Uncharacterized protein n=1 Tax=Rhizobium daejeonense TaxID=240521 RepID=A0A6M1RZB1_9HYPH|nr:hypothetical protein [Rhizobium daejeonense]NGO64399.1 hypothetical protein [Rhizobium daejeonense]